MQILGSLRKLTALSLMQLLSFQWSMRWEALTRWVFIIVFLSACICPSLLALPPESRWGWMGVGGWSLSIADLLRWSRMGGQAYGVGSAPVKRSCSLMEIRTIWEQVRRRKGSFVFVLCLSLCILNWNLKRSKLVRKGRMLKLSFLGKTQWRMASYTEDDNIDKKLINMAKFILYNLCF